VTVDDAGTVLNPVLAEGQRHGGIAQGVAQALLEEFIYDADANPLTASLAEAPDGPLKDALLRLGREVLRSETSLPPVGRDRPRSGQGGDI